MTGGNHHLSHVEPERRHIKRPYLNASAGETSCREDNRTF